MKIIDKIMLSRAISSLVSLLMKLLDIFKKKPTVVKPIPKPNIIPKIIPDIIKPKRKLFPNLRRKKDE